MTARPRVVVVLSMFPLYDELFLLREMAALSAHVDLHVFSLRRSRQTLVHALARPLLARTLSPPDLLSRALAMAHLRCVRRDPRRYFRALGRLVRGNLTSPGFLLKNLLFFPKAVYLAEWARAHGVRHVHAAWATFPASVAMLAADLAGITFSFAGHAHDIYVNTTGLPAKIRRAAFVATCTAANREHLLGLAPEVPGGRVVVLRHGIHVRDFAAAPRRAAPVLELLSVGTLYPHKGFTHLVDALRVLRDRGLRFRCTIAGDGPQRARLEDQARRLGLADAVTFTGALTQAELIPLYRRVHVFVLMAQSEWHWGIPNVIIEAMAARAAVITTRFGSVEELVRHGETGLLVPPRDPGAIADAIAALGSDAALRVRLAEAAYEAVARDYDLAQTVRGYLERLPVPRLAAVPSAPAAVEPLASTAP